jgi:hypothetical protein
MPAALLRRPIAQARTAADANIQLPDPFHLPQFEGQIIAGKGMAVRIYSSINDLCSTMHADPGRISTIGSRLKETGEALSF